MRVRAGIPISEILLFYFFCLFNTKIVGNAVLHWFLAYLPY